MKRKDRARVLKAAPVSPDTMAIICTMGPRVSLAGRNADGRFPEPNALVSIEELVEQGMAAARINFSHVRAEDHPHVERLIKAIRAVEESQRIPIPIIMDLQGPEIRLREIVLEDSSTVTSLAVEEGDRVQVLDIEDRQTPSSPGVKARLFISYPGSIYSEVERGHSVVIGDNDVYLKVEKKRHPDTIICRAQHRGLIRSGKHLGLPDVPGGRLSCGPRDVKEDAATIAHGFDVDLVAQSFVQSADDIRELVRMMDRSPTGRRPVIAKIESPAAVQNIDDILASEDVFGIMVARGDLGVLVDYARIPQIQRELIDKANVAGKPVIVATQLLESMMDRPRPHRSEPQDIATAIEEGADALMLSGETAAGDFPLESVRVMARVARATMPIDRKAYLTKFKGEYTRTPATRNIHVIGHPICELAEEARAPLIVSYASTGVGATMVSRFRPTMPILAITTRVETARRLRLLYGVHPVLVDPGTDPETGEPRDLPRTAEPFVRFVRAVVEELGLVGKLAVSGRFIVGTLHNAIEDIRSRAIFTFKW